jgi:predicted amidohydrolase
MKLTISLAQMDIAFGDPAANLQKVYRLADEAARRGSDILLLPELWSTGYDLANAAAYAAPLDEGIFAELAALAKSRSLYLLGSNLSLLGPGRYGNTAVLFAPSGEKLAVYSKIHLFRLMDEERYLAPGAETAAADLPWGKAGLAICYDLRFPELFRHYALTGANMVFVPAEWPHPRLAHWRTLLRARAIENQMFIVACNRVGAAGETRFFGHSCIIDPWGEIVVEAGEGEMLVTAVIDTDLVAQTRRKIPIFADRRPELY